MIKIERVHIDGFEAAFRGMRNPLESWDKSDSNWEDGTIGENDLMLAKKLSKAGSDHSKFLRMINVTADITAPLYWWKEYDTYKVGTVANSCSTMHKIHAKEFTHADFSLEHIGDVPNDNPLYEITFYRIIVALNEARRCFLVTKDKRYWWQMIQLLPSSYNQTRTVQLNYQVLKNMYHARNNHKLDEWKSFCEWALNLPYFKAICVDGQTDDVHGGITQ